MPRPKIPLYLISVLFFMLILPGGSAVWEHYRGSDFGWVLIGKWFVFWAIGMRLLVAGIRQATKPAFTAKEIFHMSGEESFPVIRELGFANICVGLLGILSLFHSAWHDAAALTGGLYFGLAGMLHLFKKPDSRNEVIALVSDLYLFLIMLLYLLAVWF